MVIAVFLISDTLTVSKKQISVACGVNNTAAKCWLVNAQSDRLRPQSPQQVREFKHVLCITVNRSMWSVLFVASSCCSSWIPQCGPGHICILTVKNLYLHVSSTSSKWLSEWSHVRAELSLCDWFTQNGSSYQVTMSLQPCTEKFSESSALCLSVCVCRQYIDCKICFGSFKYVVLQYDTCRV